MEETSLVNTNNLNYYSDEARDTAENGNYVEKTKKKKSLKMLIIRDIILIVSSVVMFFGMPIIGLLIDGINYRSHQASKVIIDEYARNGHFAPGYFSLGGIYVSVVVAPVLFITSVVFLIIHLKRKKAANN